LNTAPPPAFAALATPAGASLIEARGLQVRAGERRLVEGLDLELRRGEFLAVLGRNGAGKTLLLHTLAGLRAPAAGELWLLGQPLAARPRREVALALALLPQDVEAIPAATVLEAVLVGRYAHQGPWGGDDPRDRELALAALQRLGVVAHAGRELATLSGGEQRRVGAAATLAQQAPVVLLDEPTNHLDPHHQLAVLDVFAAHARDGGAVIASLHDPTLAARYADRVLLLHGDGRWQCGPAAQLLNPADLSALYLTGIVELQCGARRVFTSA
jgi:iron complex transport system ATP-binding protein